MTMVVRPVCCVCRGGMEMSATASSMYSMLFRSSQTSWFAVSSFKGSKACKRGRRDKHQHCLIGSQQPSQINSTAPWLKGPQTPPR